ncbi:hypothetical protein BC332_17019 [Capsicum chinense]|uniref:zinc finger protein ZAT5 n=1 Tax=Capsicum annuum TaxID=4072 RepID=UPI0007BEF109|nr:zinc finger protein ZAT5 [Capsicum annuum]KAF3627689.1 putative histone H2B.1-like [Capsicum annuum]KAF3673762.1 putative histone H2B.1-like [Capsicum annuum]PHU15814.1 hypothetical protein BC332_17019 [Capsicum chinense]
MEFSEDSIDRTLVFKGKRSKRPRQFMAVAMVTSTSSTACDGGAGGGASGSNGGSGDVGRGGHEIYSSSPTTSTTQISTSSTSEEDEDMANCLILLAQSGRCEKLQVETTERKMVKISSRKFAEMATTSTGSKAGFYVYECKTCNRTFPSFQALGGHRTSHKKIKTVTEDKKSTADSNSQLQQGHHHQQQLLHQHEEKSSRIITPSVNYSTGNSNSVANLINIKPKIHECSICGAEFSSGQALGGHMRRHRPPTITTTATNTKNITVDEISNTSDNSSHDENSKENKPKIFLSLDLNLPASPEDHDHQRDAANFEFSANQQNLMFSAAALVDCHY